ncbi:hypothetical protein EVAR_95372_1 [Eumeta japonica]|uniref:Uncharacterized protein n=1 Tax=Eumeta variegata TaxID=151549 RepID=A0A4C1U9D2_EUMVA|nr:hypothetical protein EVAR_95372_1 [Eumeta japonica]
MENNPDRFSVIARSRKQVARPHARRARCDPPISVRRSPSSRHLTPINAHNTMRPIKPAHPGIRDIAAAGFVARRGNLVSIKFVAGLHDRAQLTTGRAALEV